MTPWIIGTATVEPHSGQAGGVARRLCLLCFRIISLFITAGEQLVSLQVTSLTVEAAGTRVQRNIVGRFLVVGT